MKIATPSPKMPMLIERLVDKTNRGELNWEVTSQEDVFQVSFPEFSIRLFPIQRDETRIDYALAIFDQEQKLIDEVTDVVLAPLMGNAFEIMDSLYSAARRNALGVDLAIENVLKALGGEEPPATGEEPPTTSEDLPF